MNLRKRESILKKLIEPNQSSKINDISSCPAICRERYKRTSQKYDEQFRKELQYLERSQPNAHEAMRFHRHFAITTLWPPLHTRKEIEWSMKYFEDPFTPKERRRLEKILAEKIYDWLLK